MKEIESAEEFIIAASRQGVELEEIEADVALSYLDGHDYNLLLRDDLRMVLHNVQDGDNHEDDSERTIRDVIEFCLELNSLLLTLVSKPEDKPDRNYLLDLRKDKLVLEGVVKKVEAATMPVYRIYDVAIVETLKKVVPVKATSAAEAKMKAREDWKSGQYVLYADDFSEVTFTVER